MFKAMWDRIESGLNGSRNYYADPTGPYTS